MSIGLINYVMIECYYYFLLLIIPQVVKIPGVRNKNKNSSLIIVTRITLKSCVGTHTVLGYVCE